MSDMAHLARATWLVYTTISGQVAALKGLDFVPVDLWLTLGLRPSLWTQSSPIRVLKELLLTFTIHNQYHWGPILK
jgi:hypothetical protein